MFSSVDNILFDCVSYYLFSTCVEKYIAVLLRSIFLACLHDAKGGGDIQINKLR